jgi:hypothetical protein
MDAGLRIRICRPDEITPKKTSNSDKKKHRVADVIQDDANTIRLILTFFINICIIQIQSKKVKSGPDLTLITQCVIMT